MQLVAVRQHKDLYMSWADVNPLWLKKCFVQYHMLSGLAECQLLLSITTYIISGPNPYMLPFKLGRLHSAFSLASLMSDKLSDIDGTFSKLEKSHCRAAMSHALPLTLALKKL
jgi:hypothetical protein